MHKLPSTWPYPELLKAESKPTFLEYCTMVHHGSPCASMWTPFRALPFFSSLHLEIHRGLPVDDQADVGLINALSIRVSGHHQIDLLRLKVLGMFGTRRALMRLGIDWLAILWINVGNIGQPTHKDSQVITPVTKKNVWRFQSHRKKMNRSKVRTCQVSSGRSNLGQAWINLNIFLMAPEKTTSLEFEGRFPIYTSTDHNLSWGPCEVA